jgi:hypothetical protein
VRPGEVIGVWAVGSSVVGTRLTARDAPHGVAGVVEARAHRGQVARGGAGGAW